jgi:hypothetical protein
VVIGISTTGKRYEAANDVAQRYAPIGSLLNDLDQKRMIYAGPAGKLTLL